MPVINKLVDKITEYIRLKGEKIKLDVIAQVSRLLAHFVTFMLIAVLAFFLLIFLSIALATWLNAILDSSHLGYLIVAGVYLLCLIVLMIILKSNKMQQWLEALFIKISESQKEEEELEANE